jgi:phosphoribosylglycinamide formyltransferase 1
MTRGAPMSKRVGVLISGRGTNLQALLDAARSGRLGGEVALVISNIDGAPGLKRARAAGVESLVLDHRGRERGEYDTALVERFRGHGVGLVCLAGFMRRLSRVFVEAFHGRALNVHPSLLPAFPGLEAQRQAFEYGVKISGATVHFVEEGLDTGPILLQEPVAVRDDDTIASLSARILEAEHRIYPRAVRLLLEGRCRLEGRRVHVDEAA